MTKTASIEITGKIVDMLSEVPSDERLRIVNAALTLLGENSVSKPSHTEHDRTAEADSFHPRVQIWMKQNGVSIDQLLHVFHLAGGEVSLIASSPGKDTKERSLNAYVLAGLAKLLETGEPNFHDQLAREFCRSSGCYDQNNHATYLKGKGNEFAGSKERGWTLTAPGLKRAATLVHELAT